MLTSERNVIHLQVRIFTAWRIKIRTANTHNPIPPDAIRKVVLDLASDSAAIARNALFRVDDHSQSLRAHTYDSFQARTSTRLSK